MSSASTYPPRPASGRLNDLWDSPVKDLVLLPAPTLSAALVERHLLYCYLLMAILAYYWNGNKHGRFGTYPGGRDRSGPTVNTWAETISVTTSPASLWMVMAR